MTVITKCYELLKYDIFVMHKKNADALIIKAFSIFLVITKFMPRHAERTGTSSQPKHLPACSEA